MPLQHDTSDRATSQLNMSAGVGLRRGSGVAALGTAKATVSVRAATTAAWRSVAATKGLFALKLGGGLIPGRHAGAEMR
jgi:hypothetical protein